MEAGTIGKTDVMVTWARIMFGCWLLSTIILFLINYRAYLPPEIKRHIPRGFMLHVAGFFIGSALAWFAFARGSIFKTVLIFAGLFALGAILETSQLLVAYRYFNFKDMIANGLGIGLFLLCLPLVSRLTK